MVVPIRHRIESFSKGLILSVAEDDAPQDSLVTAKNVAYSKELSSISACPVPKHEPSITGFRLPEDGRLYCSADYYGYKGTAVRIFIIDKKVVAYDLSSETLTILGELEAIPARASIVVYNNDACIFYGGGKPKVVCESDGGLYFGDLTEDSIAGDIAVVSNEKIFIAGDRNAPSMLYFSATGESRDFHSSYDAGAIYVSPNDGDEITAIVPFDYKLYVFKKNSIWVLAGKTPDEFVLENVVRGVGALSPSSVIKAPTGIYFISESGLYRLSGALERIDANIYTHIGSLSDKTIVSDAVSISGGVLPSEAKAIYRVFIPNLRMLYSLSGSIYAWSEDCTYVRVSVKNKGGQWVSVAEAQNRSKNLIEFSIKEGASGYVQEGAVEVEVETDGSSLNVEFPTNPFKAVCETTHNNLCAFYIDGLVYFRLPNRIFVFDERVQAFSEAEFTPYTSFFQMSKGGYLTDESGRAYFISPTTTAEYFELKTPKINFGELGQEKIFRFVRLKLNGNGRVSAVVETDVGKHFFEKEVRFASPDIIDLNIYDRAVWASLYLKAYGSISLNGSEIVFVPVKERA